VDWINTAITGVSVLVALVSLYLYHRGQQATLSEHRRPFLSVVTEPHPSLGKNHRLVGVHNAGPGVALKVDVSLEWATLSGTSRGKGPVLQRREALQPGGREGLREVGCTTADVGRAWGTITSEDSAGVRYWWQRIGPDDDWQSGTGSPPGNT